MKSMQLLLVKRKRTVTGRWPVQAPSTLNGGFGTIPETFGKENGTDLPTKNLTRQFAPHLEQIDLFYNPDESRFFLGYLLVLLFFPFQFTDVISLYFIKSFFAVAAAGRHPGSYLFVHCSRELFDSLISFIKVPY